MCEIHSWPSDPGGELSTADFAKFISDPLLKKLEVVRITGGEPFLRDDLPEIYRLADAATAARFFYVTTNGSFPDRAEELVVRASAGKAKVQIMVSLDALTDEHDRLRGVPGMKDRAIETLRRLAGLKKKHDFLAGVNQTVMKTTLAQMAPVHELALELGLGHSMFLGARFHEGKDATAAGVTGGAIPFETQDAMSREEVETFYRTHKLLKRDGRAPVSGGAHDGLFLRDISEEYLNEGGRNRLLFGRAAPRPPCMAMFAHFRLYPDGAVAACSVFRNRPAGRAPQTPFSDIWLGPRARELRKEVKRCAGCWIECDINPSVFFSGDIIPWFAGKMIADGEFRKRYLAKKR